MKPKFLYSIIVLILIYFSLIGGDCEKILNQNNIITGDLIGKWKLTAQTGVLQDICADEVVDFKSNGIADLTCPNASTISRSFTVSNDVLTYETSVSYSIDSLTSSTLFLIGENVSRNLLYVKIPADYNQIDVKNESSNINSSEIKK